MERWYHSTDSLANLYLFRANVFFISAVVVQCSLLCFSLVVACDGRERAFSWGHRLGNNFIPDSWYDFGKLQCYCVPQFLHQHTPSDLPFLLSFSFWEAGMLQVRSGLVFKFKWFWLKHCPCRGLLIFPSTTGLFHPRYSWLRMQQAQQHLLKDELGIDRTTAYHLYKMVERREKQLVS